MKLVVIRAIERRVVALLDNSKKGKHAGNLRRVFCRVAYLYGELVKEKVLFSELSKNTAHDIWENFRADFLRRNILKRLFLHSVRNTKKQTLFYVLLRI